MALYIALGVCAVAAAVLVHRHDLYDREPPGLLLLTAFAGAVLMALAGRAEDLTIYAATSTPPSWWIATAAAFWEELARVAIVGALCLWVPRYFNDPMDGVTYGSIAGLGMAAFESVLYLGLDPPLDWTLAAPEVVRQYAHLVLGGIAGFPFGMLRVRMGGAGAALAACTAAAMVLHFLIDWSGLKTAGIPDAEGLHTGVVLGATVAATLLYGGLTVLASEWSRRRFAPWTLKRLVDWPFRLHRPVDDSPG